jgi:hypothetical protein
MSEQPASTAMDDGAEWVGRELRVAVDLICRSGGGVVFEEFPGALQEMPLSEAGGEAAADGTRAAWGPDVAAPRLLLAAADTLAETLAQLDAVARRPRDRSSRSPS